MKPPTDKRTIADLEAELRALRPSPLPPDLRRALLRAAPTNPRTRVRPFIVRCLAAAAAVAVMVPVARHILRTAEPIPPTIAVHPAPGTNGEGADSAAVAGTPSPEAPLRNPATALLTPPQVCDETIVRAPDGQPFRRYRRAGWDAVHLADDARRESILLLEPRYDVVYVKLDTY